MEYEEMRRMEKTHVCAQCDGELVTRWSGKRQQYELVCANHWDHHGYTRRLTQGQLFSQGRADNDLGPGAQEDLEKAAEQLITDLSKLPATDIATKTPLSDVQIGALVAWGEHLGLKPHLGHVCIYHGKPYVTIDGYYYLLAKNHPAIKIGTRPLTKEELELELVFEGTYAWIAEAWENGEKLPTTGLGFATKEEIAAKSARDPGQFRAPVVHDHPQRMAEKRAEWQLLRKLIPLGGSD